MTSNWEQFPPEKATFKEVKADFLDMYPSFNVMTSKWKISRKSRLKLAFYSKNFSVIHSNHAREGAASGVSVDEGSFNESHDITSMQNQNDCVTE